ncbi:MAG TPA: AIR synthase [Clostridiaceae bacterium]|nr:AIR synthase [Clostridiaceae bacterium]
MKLEVGKIPNDILEKLLDEFTDPIRPEVLTKPGIGEDCAALDLSGDLCVVTTDPITGADDEIGTLGIHIALNDLASAGAEPVGILVTILAPPGTELETVERLTKQMKAVSAAMKVDILGGHTEVTDAVNRMVLSITAIGKSRSKELISTNGAKPGDSIILTKYAACEGTAILAWMFEKELTKEFGEEFVNSAKNLLNNISVVKEGLLAARYGVSSMHDVTEGGVLGAAWEIGTASGYGVEIYKDRIPILEETRRICSFLSIDPLKLISSGSMLITTPNGEELIKILNRNDIKASEIGRVTFGREFLLIDEENTVKITIPESDELYKARKMKGEI